MMDPWGDPCSNCGFTAKMFLFVFFIENALKNREKITQLSLNVGHYLVIFFLKVGAAFYQHFWFFKRPLSSSTANPRFQTVVSAIQNHFKILIKLDNSIQIISYHQQFLNKFYLHYFKRNLLYERPLSSVSSGVKPPAFKQLFRPYKIILKFW